MKYLTVFLTLVIGLHSMAQSKKEQIAILTYRVDSLKREYLKDTTQLQNTIETMEREYTILSDQYDEAQELIKKKAATISEKTNTIKSVNNENMHLMEERKELQKKLNELELSFKDYKDSLKNDLFLFSLSNGARPIEEEGEKLPVEVEIGLYINGRFYIIDKFDNVAWPAESDPEDFDFGTSIRYKYRKGYKEGIQIEFIPDNLGWMGMEIEIIQNQPYIIYTSGGGDSQTVTMRKLGFDINQNIDLIQIFKATVTFGGGGIDCVSGDCDYKGYLSSKYPDEY